MAGGVFSGAKLNAMTIRESANDGSDFTNPDADYRRLFLGEDGALHVKDSAGAVTNPATSSSDLAGRELDYVEKTSDSSITATSGATADTIVTGASVAYDGATIILVEFQTDGANPSGVTTADRYIDIVLYDGATELGILARARTPDLGEFVAPVRGARRLTPSAASHTYSIRAYVSAGTGTVYGGAGTAGNHMPCFMQITRVSS